MPNGAARAGSKVHVPRKLNQCSTVTNANSARLREEEKSSIQCAGDVACHEHGTTLSGLLPASWDHLVASYGTTRRVARGESSARLFDAHVMFDDVEVHSCGVQGGRRG